MTVTLSILLSLREIAHAVGAAEVMCDGLVRRICTDSREARAGDLFFALKGDQTSGEIFVQDALSQGAYVVSAQICATLCVRSPEEALLQTAALYVSKLPCLKKRIAVTGSVGKTTVKTMLSYVLSASYATHATPGNFNNALGVPLTLLGASAKTECIVSEIGISHPGDMEPLASLVRPHIAVITNVGHAHIGNFGNEDQLFEEKCKITPGLSENGTLLVPYGDVRFASIPCQTVSTQSAKADFYLACRKTNNEKTDADLFCKGNAVCSLTLPFTDDSLIKDCAMALAVALLSDVPPDRYEDALAEMRESDLRVQMKRTPGGLYLLDDAYNASPESMTEALHILQRRGKGRRCVLLGDMLELGADTEFFHREVGRLLPQFDVELAFFFGVYAPFYSTGAKLGGMDTASVFVNNDITLPHITLENILAVCRQGDTLLCKASHNTGVKSIIQNLLV